MTKDEAITVLKSTTVNLGRANGKTLYVEAMNMAISALQAQNDGGSISRQAAIDVAREELESGTYFDIPSKIEHLPSAQPEDCDTCKHGYFGDEQCNNCRVRYPSHYERRTDDQT